MKKILALVAVLALVAALVVPLAVSAAQGPGVYANTAGPTVTLTVPANNIQLGTLVQGPNPASGYIYTGSWGNVTLVKNSDAGGGCLLTASADPSFATGQLFNTVTNYAITNPLIVALEDGSSALLTANSIGYSGTVTHTFLTEGTDYFDVGAKVSFQPNDWTNGGVGSYYTVIDLSVTPAF